MFKKIDFSLLFGVILLTLFGLFMIYDISSFVAFRDFGDKYHYIKDQFTWSVIGISGLIFFSFFNYHRLYNLSLPLIILAIVMLVLVFVPGIGVQALGARRWIDARIITIQPAEFVKLTFAIYLAAWFSNKEKGRFFAFLLLIGTITFFIMLEPDMGTAFIILFEALVVYFISGANVLNFLLMLPVIIFGSIVLIMLEPYRASRMASFFSSNQSVQTASYHVKQILIALGSGGLTGVGLGNSLQKFAYLPENTTDSIFAIIAEEVGFIGSTLLIFLFIFVVWRGFLIASTARDLFGKLLACGITSFLAIQMVLNLGSQTALIPLTGVPLPFISYGGSSLVIDLCAIGILLNISQQKI